MNESTTTEPDEQAIERLKAEIQEHWDEATECARRVGKSGGWRAPVIQCDEPLDGDGE